MHMWKKLSKYIYILNIKQNELETTKGLTSPLKLSWLSNILLFGTQKPKSCEPPATTHQTVVLILHVACQILKPLVLQKGIFVSNLKKISQKGVWHRVCRFI